MPLSVPPSASASPGPVSPELPTKRQGGFVAEPKKRPKWVRRLYRLFWLFLALLALALVGLHYATQETFLRGPVLRRILGPDYDRNLTLGRIDLGLFPPKLSVFDLELRDTRPGPEDPEVVAQLERLVFDFRFLPAKRLMLDRVEVRGLRLDLVRDATGIVNLSRAVGDMQQGRIPPPIAYERLAGEPSSKRQILLVRWAASDWRLRLEDRYEREQPLRLELALPTLPLLRGDPDKPLDLASGLPLKVHGYVRLDEADAELPARPPSVHPLEGEITLTHLFETARAGAAWRLGLLPRLTHDEIESFLPNTEWARFGAPLPEWPAALADRSFEIRVEGNYAVQKPGDRKIGGLRVRFDDPRNGHRWLELTEGRYDLATGQSSGKLRIAGGQDQLLGALETIPGAKAPGAKQTLERLRQFAAHPEFPPESHVELEGNWTFHPLEKTVSDSMRPIPQRHRFTAFSSGTPRGEFSFRGTLILEVAPPSWMDFSRAPTPPERLRTVLRTELDGSWPGLDFDIRAAEWEIALLAPRIEESVDPAAAAAAASESTETKPLSTSASSSSGPKADVAPSQPQVLLRGHLANPPCRIPLPLLLAAGPEKRIAPPDRVSSSASATPIPGDLPEDLVKIERPPVDGLDHAIRKVHRLAQDLVERTSPLDRTPLVVKLEVPPLPMAWVPWPGVAGDPAGGEQAKATLRAEISLFPEEDTNLRVQGEARLAGLRKHAEHAPVDLSGSLAAALRTDERIELETLRATWQPTAGAPCEILLRDAFLDLATGEGDVYAQLIGLNRGHLDQAALFGRGEVGAWIEKHRTLTRLLGTLRDDLPTTPLLGGPTLDVRLRARIAEKTRINGEMVLNRLSSRALGFDDGTPERRFDLILQAETMMNRVQRTLDIGHATATFLERGASQPVWAMRHSTREPARFAVRSVPALAEAAVNLLELPLKKSDLPATSTLARLPTFFRLLESVGRHRLAPRPLDFEVEWNQLRSSQIAGILGDLGLSSVEGAMDLQGRLRLPPRGETITDPDRVAEWSFESLLRNLRLSPTDPPVEARLQAEGTLTRDAVRLDAATGTFGKATLHLAGFYDLLRGRGTFEARADELGAEGVAAVGAIRNNRLGEIVRMEQRLPTRLLIVAPNSHPPRFDLRWRAEIQGWNGPLAVEYEKIIRRLDPQFPLVGGLRLRSLHQIEFPEDRSLRIRAYRAFVEKDKDAPLLTAHLERPLDLRRGATTDEWIDTRTGLPPVSVLEVAADLGALDRENRIPLRQLLGRGLRSGRLNARFVSPWLDPGDTATTGVLSGTLRNLHPEEIIAPLDFDFTGGIHASRQRIEFNDFRFTPIGAPPHSLGRIRLDAYRSFDTDDYGVLCDVREVGSVLTNWTREVWRPLLMEDTARADLALSFATREQGRYEDRITTLTVRRVALSPRGLSPDFRSESSPLHPPVSLAFHRSTTHDRETSVVLLRALALEIAPETEDSASGLSPPTPLVALALHGGALRWDPEALTLLPPREATEAAAIHLRLGPVRLAPYAEAIRQWTGFPMPSGGQIALQARAGPRPLASGGWETVLDATLEVEDFHPGTLRTDANSLDGTFDFVFRSRGGVLVADRIDIRSPNEGDTPPDRISMTGTLYGRRRGFAPDVTVRGDFLNLQKYWIFIHEVLDEWETLAAKPHPSPSVRPPATRDRSWLPGPTRLRILLDHIQFGDIKAKNLTAWVRYDNEKITVTELLSGIGNGRVRVEGDIDIEDPAALRYRARWSLEDIAIQTFADLLFPELGLEGQGTLSGKGEFQGAGVAQARLRRHFQGTYSLVPRNVNVRPKPGERLIGPPEGLSARVVGRIANNVTDFTVEPLDEEANHSIALRGFIHDLFGIRRLRALAHYRIQTAVGARPHRSTGRLTPFPQSLLGLRFRIDGPLDHPDKLAILLDTYEF